MSLFFESIKLQNGAFFRLKYHQERVNKAFLAFYPNEEPISLLETMSQHVVPQKGIFKCRIVYDSTVQSVEFTPYNMREIKSLQLLKCDLPSLPYKAEDRTGFNFAFAKRGNCDDVLLLKNGLLTDTSYSNIALFDGKDWFTPRIPLLYGTNRAELLETGKIMEKDIKAEELKNYKQIALFNAMIEFGEMVLDINTIKH